MPMTETTQAPGRSDANRRWEVLMGSELESARTSVGNALTEAMRRTKDAPAGSRRPLALPFSARHLPVCKNVPSQPPTRIYEWLLPRRRNTIPSRRPARLEARLKRERNPAVRLFMMLGPGLITGASDDDPSGIGTYATAGASMGYATLWLAWVTFPLMAAVQYICAKVGLVTGRGLAGVLREHYPKALLYPVVLLLLIANTINAGVDVGAIGAGLNLLFPIPYSSMCRSSPSSSSPCKSGVRTGSSPGRSNG